MACYELRIDENITLDLVKLNKNGELKITKGILDSQPSLTFDINWPPCEIKQKYTTEQERDHEYDIIVGNKEGIIWAI